MQMRRARASLKWLWKLHPWSLNQQQKWRHRKKRHHPINSCLQGLSMPCLRLHAVACCPSTTLRRLPIQGIAIRSFLFMERDGQISRRHQRVPLPGGHGLHYGGVSVCSVPYRRKDLVAKMDHGTTRSKANKPGTIIPGIIEHNYGKSLFLIGKSTISTGPWLQ